MKNVTFYAFLYAVVSCNEEKTFDFSGFLINLPVTRVVEGEEA
jgi:hypothetical protein